MSTASALRMCSSTKERTAVRRSGGRSWQDDITASIQEVERSGEGNEGSWTMGLSQYLRRNRLYVSASSDEFEDSRICFGSESELDRDYLARRSDKR